MQKKKQNLKITIITVCYNSEKTINETLKSVANQNYQNIEHLIIDGKSTDQTLSIIKKYSHVSKIISEIDDGIYDAMNKGMQISTGDIIGFLNSDDFYTNQNILSTVNDIFVQNPSIDGCYSDLIYSDQNDTSKNIRYWKSSNFVPGLFSKGWCPPHPTFFLRNLVYKKYGKFNLNYRIASDIELMMRLLEVNKIKTFYKPEFWVKMSMGGMTNKNLLNIFNQNLEVLRALKNHKLPYNILSFFVYKLISRSLQFAIIHKNIKKFLNKS